MNSMEKYQKRDCNIIFNLTHGNYEGSQDCTIIINGDKHKFWLSYALGDLFGRFIDVVYGLFVEANDPYTDHSLEYVMKDGYHIAEIVGKTLWDNEGSALTWTLSRSLQNNKKKIIKIVLDYETGEQFKYDVKLNDLLYATTRAATMIIKQLGICGYHFSAQCENINMCHFLMMKHYALTGKKLRMKKIGSEKFISSSSLKEEIELLLFDM